MAANAEVKKYEQQNTRLKEAIVKYVFLGFS